MSQFKLIFLNTALLICTTANATSNETNKCETSAPIITPHGKLTKMECGTAKSGYQQTLFVDGVPVLSDAYLFREDRNSSKTKWVFTGKPLWETGCPDKLYLLDLSMKPVKVIAFGIKKACNLFDWASWGEKRSVIALKNNVRFTYENGKMILPPAGEKLWNSIEPPHTGPGVILQDAVPFAENVPLPK